MKEQIKLLLEVQRHDARIQELEAQKKAFPTKLEAMHEDLSRVETMLDRERNALKDTESWRRKQEEEMKAEEDQLIKARQKSTMVKNVKEHMATERELQSSRERGKEREEEVLKLMNAVEEAKKRIVQHEADFVALKEHVKEEEEQSKSKLSDLDGQIAAERKLRDKAATTVHPDALKRYSAIRMKRGLALVAVKNGTCQGCNMNIPPQVFNMIQRGDSMELCGNCNRIIYWDKMMEDPDGKPAEATK